MPLKTKEEIVELAARVREYRRYMAKHSEQQDLIDAADALIALNALCPYDPLAIGE